jgi:ribosomal protein S18 acetylase RimI-like enzyme
MTVLEQITSKNASIFKSVRLQALQDSPSAFGSTYAKESQYSDADWLKRAADWSNDRSVGYLAMAPGEPCGIAAAFLDEHDPCKAHLVSMWVAPAYRRSGIGLTLIEAIRVWAVIRGTRLLRLNVTSNNLIAIEFYKRNGFSMTGNTEPYPNDPTLIEYEMSRSVSFA